MGDVKSEFDRLLEMIANADQALVQILDDRAQAVVALQSLAKQQPEAYFRAPSDREVIERGLRELRHFPSAAFRAVMTEVLSGSHALVAPLEIAYLGQPGGFGHLAARRQFGASAKLRPMEDAAALLAEIESGRCTFGLLPFESSSDGAVTATLNALARYETKISAEIWLNRSFDLLSTTGESASIHRVYGSSVALQDCAKFLAHKYREVETIDVRSGVVAAKKAEEDPQGAAIATEVVSEMTGLKPVEQHVEDASDLRIRFVVVGHDYPARTGQDRTALAVALQDSHDGMASCLQPFAERGIGMHRLETRPARGWEFRFLMLLEIDGHVTDRSVLAAIGDLRASGAYVRILGSFPRVDET